MFYSTEQPEPAQRRSLLEQLIHDGSYEDSRGIRLLDLEPSTCGDMPLLDEELERAHRVANGCVEPDDLRWLSKGFSAFLAGGGTLPLERCLRLLCNDSALRRACRDYWLRLAWKTLQQALSPWRRSEALAVAIRDFESRKWARWRTLQEPPLRANEIEAALFHAFQACDRIPRTAMQLHNIAYHRRHS
jgi:hypothetical protein